MSLVNALRFSRLDGAMITDEEYWLHARRRTYFQDNLHSLLSPEIANKSGVELLYGGTGDPYFHYEVVGKARRKLAESMANGAIKGKDSPVYEAAKQVMQIVQTVSRLRIEQKMYLFFGFGLDDINRGYYEKNGKKYSIKQECIRNKALEILQGKDKNSDLKELLKSRALLMGYDKEEGVQLFYVNVENQVLSFNSGDYDTIGTGIYGAGHVFSNYMRQKTMAKRLQGYPRVEAMVALIESALVASQTYKAIGGYFNILYLDGRGRNHSQRVKPIMEERAKLATEIVDAYKKNFITPEVCYELIDSLIFQNASIDEVDERFFQKSCNPFQLELYLRGYKLDFPSQEIVELKTAGKEEIPKEPPKTPKLKKKKGGGK